MMIGRIQSHLLDVLIPQRLHHGVAGHMKGRVVFLAQHLAVLANALYSKAARMNPVRSNLSADISPVIGHALHKFLKQIEVFFALIESVHVVRHV